MGILKAVKNMMFNAVPDLKPIDEAEKALKKDFNRMLKEDYLANYRAEIEGMYDEINLSFLKGFEEALAKTKNGDTSVDIKGCFHFFVHDFFINDKGGLYIKDQIAANFKFFSLGIGYMVGILRYHFDYILQIEGNFETWASQLISKMPFLFEYLQEQAFLSIDRVGARIREQERELRKNGKEPDIYPALRMEKSRLEEVKGILKKCELL